MNDLANLEKWKRYSIYQFEGILINFSTHIYTYIYIYLFICPKTRLEKRGGKFTLTAMHGQIACCMRIARTGSNVINSKRVATRTSRTLSWLDHVRLAVFELIRFRAIEITSCYSTGVLEIFHDCGCERMSDFLTRQINGSYSMQNNVV